MIDHEFKEVILQVENVGVNYDKPVLKDVNLTVRNLVRPGMTQGQVVGLLGPSGVGKTTLFRILAGLDKPATGRVLVGSDLKPVKRGMVGVVAQNYPLFAHRTVWGNLIVAGKQDKGCKTKEINEKASKLLEDFNILEHKEKYPSQLSGGQRQRVAIAQQFMCSEHFLLMDEPFSGLDLVAQHRVSKFISDMAQTDELKTFVLVTHDVSAALEVCDTIWLFGRDRDEEGKAIPGARVQKTLDLIERGLAYREDIRSTPEYMETLKEIYSFFPKL
jgi:NitT/TauT family transport system ATP-binding protein